MSMNNVCPDYKCIMNCKVNRGYSSREHCITCGFNFGCIDCKNRHCFHILYNPGNYYHDYVKNPVETQQD